MTTPTHQPDRGDPGRAGAHGRLLQVGIGTLKLFEIIGLVVITIATLIAGGQEVWRMVVEQQVSLADLLLLFIYLEVLTMVGIYLESGALPVRLPLYIAIVALARHLILDMKSMSEAALLATSGAVLILALAVLATRYGHFRFPYQQRPPGPEPTAPADDPPAGGGSAST